MSFETFLYSLLGGILPALVWLFFWLREDRKNPEPDNLILKTFLLGMISVILVLPFQKSVEMLFPGLATLSIVIWASLEEIFKLGAGYFGGLRSAEENEPVDALIYMITSALGFVALENTLFIFGPLANNDISQGIITGNLRFIGASLLHVVSSGIIGFTLASFFYKTQAKKVLAGAMGLVGAIGFHTLFNMLIIKNGQLGTVYAFFSVWLGVTLLLLAFEKVKSIAPKADTGI
jgi:RsiW-degrading membrane proteinase PrsW (M82 family)